MTKEEEAIKSLDEFLISVKLKAYRKGYDVGYEAGCRKKK